MLPEKRLRPTQAGEPGQRPSTSRRKSRLVTVGANPQALSTSARFLPSSRPLYQLLVAPVSPSQPPLPSTCKPLKSRSMSCAATPRAVGRNFSATLPNRSSPRYSFSMLRSSAGTLRGSNEANGSGPSSDWVSAGSAGGRRSVCRRTTIGAALASGRRALPMTSLLSRRRSQAAPPRVRRTTAWFRFMPKAFSWPMLRSTLCKFCRALPPGSSPAKRAACSCQGPRSRLSSRPLTRSP